MILIPFLLAILAIIFVFLLHISFTEAFILTSILALIVSVIFLLKKLILLFKIKLYSRKHLLKTSDEFIYYLYPNDICYNLSNVIILSVSLINITYLLPTMILLVFIYELTTNLFHLKYL